MSTCEKCGNEHDMSYGTGRFCGSRCAHSFVSEQKRKEMNARASETLKGRVGHKRQMSVEERHLRKWSYEMKAAARARMDEKFGSRSWEQLSKWRRRKIIINERGEKCESCGIGAEWNGKPLKLQFDHVDGDRKNESKSNLRMLCPNCHSQTPTWGFRNSKLKRGSTR